MGDALEAAGKLGDLSTRTHADSIARTSRQPDIGSQGLGCSAGSGGSPIRSLSSRSHSDLFLP
jgi:hypothetical protein